MLPQTARGVDRLVVDAQATGRIPALTVAVFRDGNVIHVATAGDTPLPGPDLQYRIGSITKTFTAALVLRLRDEGHLALDDLLYRHLPGTPLGGITLRQLLSHTSGLQREPDGPWWERCAGPELDTFLADLGADQLAYPPLRGHHYSNLAYGLLGAVLGRLTGEEWMSMLTKRITEPLGLGSTTYAPIEPYARGYVVHPWHDTLREEPRHDSGAMAPAGQLWSTVTDLARWGAFLAAPDPTVLDPATVAEMCAPVAMSDLDGWTGGHGLGLELWRRGERVFVGHTGSMPGYQAVLAVHRASRTGIAALANSYSRPGGLADLALAVLTEVCEREPAPVPPWRPAAPPPADLAPLTGRWWWMGREHEARWDGLADELILTPVGAGRPAAADRWRFGRDTGRDRWRGRSGANDGEILRVLRDPAGAVIGLDLATRLLTREPGDEPVGVGARNSPG
jgi:CubicO group peptidase (beta-lactamase class C family)